MNKATHSMTAEEKEEVNDVAEITCVPLWRRWSVETKENKQE